MKRLRPVLPWLAIIAPAVLMWAVFYPGLLSWDSMMHYEQAVRGCYDDWHPPLPSIILGGFMRAGLGLPGLMLAQAIAGALGVAALAFELLSLWRPDLPRRTRRWRSACVFLFLFGPWSVLSFYLVTLWKDAWESILLVWTVAMLVHLYPRRSLPPARFYPRFALAVALILAASLVRHNAILLALGFIPALLVLLWERRSRATTALAALPLLLLPVGHAAITRGFDVHHQYIQNVIVAAELVEFCKRYPELRGELPYTDAHIRGREDLQHFHFPEAMDLMVQLPVVKVDLEYVRPQRNVELTREYRSALLRWPWKFARLKLETFSCMTVYTGEWFYPRIEYNEFGLDLNDLFIDAREPWMEFGRRAASTPLRWMFGVHAVWLALGLGAWLFLLRRGWRQRDATAFFLATLVFVLLAYAASYLLVAPSVHYRFLYPATLPLHIGVLAWMAASLELRQEP